MTTGPTQLPHTHNLTTHNLLTHNLLTHNLLTYNLSPHNLSTHNFAWHLVTSTVTLRGRRGTYGIGLALVARLGPRWTPLSPRLLAWQTWHWVTSTFTLRSRRGTYGIGLALVARLGLRRTPLLPRLLAWQAWHLVTSTITLRGRRGTWRHRPSLCMASVAIMALDWLWWRAWVSVGRRCRRGCWQGRRGTW